jgi:RNA polymerase sigma-70 factor (ECF subfamily)
MLITVGKQVSSSTATRFSLLQRTAEPNRDIRTEKADEVLIAFLARGDQQALGHLFQRYARIVRSIGEHILRDHAEAEDLVQDVFLFIQRRCAIFDSSKGSGRSWIVQMAYQRAIERRRRLAVRHFYNYQDLESAAGEVVGIPTTEDDYSPEAVFGRNGLDKLLSALSEDQRETLRLYFFEGYTLAEISAKLAQPMGTIRHHYYRGLDKLRRQMFGRKVRGS